MVGRWLSGQWLVGKWSVDLIRWIYFVFLSYVFCIDVSSNRITFRIQEQWDQKYSDPTTSEYLNLKQQTEKEVNE